MRIVATGVQLHRQRAQQVLPPPPPPPPQPLPPHAARWHLGPQYHRRGIVRNGPSRGNRTPRTPPYTRPLPATGLPLSCTGHVMIT